MFVPIVWGAGRRNQTGKLPSSTPLFIGFPNGIYFWRHAVHQGTPSFLGVPLASPGLAKVPPRFPVAPQGSPAFPKAPPSAILAGSLAGLFSQAGARHRQRHRRGLRHVSFSKGVRIVIAVPGAPPSFPFPGGWHIGFVFFVELVFVATRRASAGRAKGGMRARRRREGRERGVCRDFGAARGRPSAKTTHR